MFSACDTKVLEPEIPSTFAVIQEQIFEPNCVPCHTTGTSFAIQSDLVLTKDEAYDQLVNREPANQAAKEDGLLLVGDKGLESLYSSFLWEKINAPDFEHFSLDHPEYGELMPYGGLPLTNGELMLSSEWITKGASEQGEVADEALLLDQTRFEFPEDDYARLPMPESGYQMILGPFNVKDNFERETFYYESVGNQEEVFVNRIEISMKKGSHHFILYDYPNMPRPTPEVYRDFRNEDNTPIFETFSSISNQRFVFGTQWRSIDYTYPEGVALRVPSDTYYDLNSHYVNRTPEAINGEVSVNLHTIDASEVTHVAENLFLNNLNLSLPAQTVTTVEREWTFNERRSVFQLFSHAHEKMTEFKIYIVGGPRDGELVYFANDWQHPPLLELDPPIVLESGQGLRAETTYNNDSDRVLTFGLYSVDEMMIILGAYY